MMGKVLYYFSLIFIFILILGNILITPLFPFIDLEILSFLLVIILSLSAINMELNDRSFFIILITYFLLLLVHKLVELPYKDLVNNLLEVLLLLSFFLLIKPYLGMKIRPNFVIPPLFYFFIFLSSLYFNKMNISLFVNSFIILFLILKIFIHLWGDYMFPWLYILLGFLFKYFGSLMNMTDLSFFLAIFISLGVLKYLRVYRI